MEKTEFPPYLAVPSITDPGLQEIPALERVQVLEPGEQLVKAYQMRVRRPKFPWFKALLFLIFSTPILFGLIYAAEEARNRAVRMRQFEVWREAMDRREARGDFSSNVDVEYPEFEYVRGQDVLINTACLVPLVAGAMIGLFFLLRLRGHTFLYLTNRRLIVLELEQGMLRHDQSLLNFSIADISGFQLYTQRGLWRLLGLLLLRERRTFYLAITTRTCQNVQIGAVNTRKSRYDPGRDAVALCGELDAKVLALREQMGV